MITERLTCYLGKRERNILHINGEMQETTSKIEQ